MSQIEFHFATEVLTNFVVKRYCGFTSVNRKYKTNIKQIYLGGMHFMVALEHFLKQEETLY